MATLGPRADVDALAAECRAFAAFLEGLDAAAWQQPSRCPPMAVRELVVHMTGMLEYVNQVRDQSFIDSEPQKDRWSWWDYDVEEDQEETLQAILQEAKDYPAEPFPERFAAAAEAAVEAVEFRLIKGNPTVLAGKTAIRLNDYVATRVLEMTVHGMDVRDALGVPSAPTPEGLAVTGDILRGLLGVDLRPAITDERLCVIGTGRTAPTKAEEDVLGDHVKNFPLMG